MFVVSLSFGLFGALFKFHTIVEYERSHIGWRGERNILYKGVETFLIGLEGRWIVRSHIDWRGE